jgi:WhiB family redox-sensing transcriptional regulator
MTTTHKHPTGNPDTGRKSRIRIGDVAEMLRDGKTLPDISAAVGLATTSLAKRLNQAGYSVATGHPATQRRPDDILPIGPRGADLTWRHEAECETAGSDAFFPPGTGTGHGANVDAAKRICAACQVREQCLTHALEFHEPGIWGGTTEGERRTIRRRRSAA